MNAGGCRASLAAARSAARAARGRPRPPPDHHRQAGAHPVCGAFRHPRDRNPSDLRRHPACPEHARVRRSRPPRRVSLAVTSLAAKETQMTSVTIIVLLTGIPAAIGLALLAIVTAAIHAEERALSLPA